MLTIDGAQQQQQQQQQRFTCVRICLAERERKQGNGKGTMSSHLVATVHFTCTFCAYVRLNSWWDCVFGYGQQQTQTKTQPHSASQSRSNAHTNNKIYTCGSASSSLPLHPCCVRNMLRWRIDAIHNGSPCNVPKLLDVFVIRHTHNTNTQKNNDSEYTYYLLHCRGMHTAPQHTTHILQLNHQHQLSSVVKHQPHTIIYWPATNFYPHRFGCTIYAHTCRSSFSQLPFVSSHSFSSLLDALHLLLSSIRTS